MRRRAPDVYERYLSGWASNVQISFPQVVDIDSLVWTETAKLDVLHILQACVVNSSYVRIDRSLPMLTTWMVKDKTELTCGFTFQASR